MGNALIYYCDDDDITKMVVKAHFKDSGHELITFPSAEKLLEELNKKKPDLIISDCNMPGMDGLELLERIKHEYHEIPTILYTNDETISQRMVTDHGGDKALLLHDDKPRGKQILLDTVEAALSGDRSKLEERERVTVNHKVGEKPSGRNFTDGTN